MKTTGIVLVVFCLALMGCPGQAQAFSQVNELPDSISHMIAGDSSVIYISITDTPKTLSLVTVQRDSFGQICSLETQTWLCSPGRKGKSTPKGNFKICLKLGKAKSEKYHAMMIWWMAIDGRGIYAIHGLLGDDYLQYLGQRASHGCIRLDPETAKSLYDRVPLGTKVFIRQF